MRVSLLDGLRGRRRARCLLILAGLQMSRERARIERAWPFRRAETQLPCATLQCPPLSYSYRPTPNILMDPDRYQKPRWLGLSGLIYRSFGFQIVTRARYRTPYPAAPRFFVEVLCALCRPTKESGIEELVPADPERASAIASQAHDLFHAWRRLPGTTDDNVLDAGALESWIKEARKLSAEVGRGQVGDLQIGQMLAAAARLPSLTYSRTIDDDQAN